MLKFGKGVQQLHYTVQITTNIASTTHNYGREFHRQIVQKVVGMQRRMSTICNMLESKWHK